MGIEKMYSDAEIISWEFEYRGQTTNPSTNAAVSMNTPQQSVRPPKQNIVQTMQPPVRSEETVAVVAPSNIQRNEVSSAQLPPPARFPRLRLSPPKRTQNRNPNFQLVSDYVDFSQHNSQPTILKADVSLSDVIDLLDDE